MDCKWAPASFSKTHSILSHCNCSRHHTNVYSVKRNFAPACIDETVRTANQPIGILSCFRRSEPDQAWALTAVTDDISDMHRQSYIETMLCWPFFPQAASVKGSRAKKLNKMSWPKFYLNRWNFRVPGKKTPQYLNKEPPGCLSCQALTLWPITISLVPIYLIDKAVKYVHDILVLNLAQHAKQLKRYLRMFFGKQKVTQAVRHLQSATLHSEFAWSESST